MQCCRCKPRCTMAQDVGALVLIANGETVTQELCAVPLHATVHCRRTGIVRRSVWCRCSCRCQWGGAPRAGWFLQKLLISGFVKVFGVFEVFNLILYYYQLNRCQWSFSYFCCSAFLLLATVKIAINSSAVPVQCSRFPCCVFHICNFDICHETQQAVATPYRWRQNV